MSAHEYSGLLDELLPDPQIHTRQSIVIDADPALVWQAVLHADLASCGPVRYLSMLRALPDRLFRRLRGRPGLPDVSRADVAGLIEAGYWIVLDEVEDRELALGLVMWDSRVDEVGGAARALFERPAPGAMRVGWSFAIEPFDGGGSLLVTETRTEPADEAARRRFATYWRLVGPFADLTRHFVLRTIAADAERRAAAASRKGARSAGDGEPFGQGHDSPFPLRAS
ncbi:hypothetical protein HJD18_03715 [Thermoleophilia bacterium SCSIO 60948]|nr:hypothetical protein HJD18_03715 [Thermoleophilia bacterium SCSIO 60948]